MGMRPAARMPKLTRRSRTLIAIALTVIGLLLVGPRFIDAYVDWLWFGELGYRSVFTTVLVTRLIVFVVIGLLVGGIVFRYGQIGIGADAEHRAIVQSNAGARQVAGVYHITPIDRFGGRSGSLLRAANHVDDGQDGGELAGMLRLRRLCCLRHHVRGDCEERAEQRRDEARERMAAEVHLSYSSPGNSPGA